MEELRVSPSELKMLIDNGEMVGQGFFGTVFTYKDKLIKLNRRLYDLLNTNRLSLSKIIVEDFYKEEYKPRDFQDRNQIEFLSKKQKDITLTKLPEGILTLKDVSDHLMDTSPGIIIPYHKNHEKLENLSLLEYKRLLIILKKLLIACKELEDNRISQEDMASYGSDCDINNRSYNVMYKDDTPQIIDMSGFFIKANDNFISAKNMYRSLSDILIDYFCFYDIDTYVLRDKIETYEESKELLKVLERELKKR